MADFAIEFIAPMKEASDRGEDFEPDGYQEFYTVFKGFNDICETLETIELLQAMMEVSPPRSKRIGVDLYCKHVVSSYLNEMYILKERLNAFATKISRMYLKNQPIHCHLRDFDHLHNKIKESMGGINDTRNRHVHGERYSDSELNWLSSLKLVSEHDDSFDVSYRQQYGIVKMKWSKQISENNQAMLGIIEEYFEDVFKVICLGGKIVLPRALHASPA